MLLLVLAVICGVYIWPPLAHLIDLSVKAVLGS